MKRTLPLQTKARALQLKTRPFSWLKKKSIPIPPQLFRVTQEKKLWCCGNKSTLFASIKGPKAGAFEGLKKKWLKKQKISRKKRLWFHGEGVDARKHAPPCPAAILTEARGITKLVWVGLRCYDKMYKEYAAKKKLLRRRIDCQLSSVQSFEGLKF